MGFLDFLYALQAIPIDEEFTAGLKTKYKPEDSSEEGSFSKRSSAALNTGFDEALKSIYKHIEDILQKLCLSGNILVAEESINITSWKLLFVDYVTDLKLDILCERVFKIITFGVGSVLLRVIWNPFHDR